MKRVTFAEGQVYHVYNRGADRREVFLNDHDRYRFISDLYCMNTSEHVLHSGYHFNRSLPWDGQNVKVRPSSKLVDILAFVLMPNHYHLLLTQRCENGISLFMQKLGTAYTMYFNKLHHHSGVIFQGRFKAAMPEREAHFDYLPFYIHANPLKLNGYPGSIQRQMAILGSYKWSSYSDYSGISNFPGVINPLVLREMFSMNGGFHSSMAKWLENRQNHPAEVQPRHKWSSEVEPRQEGEPVAILI